MYYTITNTRSGITLGTYAGASPEAALDALAVDAGYQDYADMDEQVPAQPGEIIATPLRAALRARYGRYRITRDGAVHVYGPYPQCSHETGWRFVGWVDDPRLLEV
jgi:hypothetical protein